MVYTNLSDLFKGICDAIRAKKGTTGAINHQDIPAEIESIEAGTAQDVLSLASGLTKYTESFIVDGEERANVLVQPSDFSDETKVTWDSSTTYYTHSIESVDGSENGVAAVITPTSTKTTSYSNLFWYDSTVDSNTSDSKTYLIAVRVKASAVPTSYLPQMAITYYPTGSTGSKFIYFSYTPTTEWKIFYAIVNVPQNYFLQDVTMCFCNRGITYYVDWVTAYDITGTSFSNMTFGARATAAPSDVTSGKKYYKDGILQTGTMTNHGTVTKSLGQNTTSYTIPAGKHSGSGTVSLSVDSTYNSKTPTCSTQTYYPNGDAVFTSFTVNGDSNLDPSNIKNGVSIFGVTGTFSGGKTYVGKSLGSLPGANICYGWIDGIYDNYLLNSSDVLYIPIDSTYTNVLPSSVSIMVTTSTGNVGINGLISAIWDGSYCQYKVADSEEKDLIGITGKSSSNIKFYWESNYLLISIGDYFINGDEYYYIVTYN